VKQVVLASFPSRRSPLPCALDPSVNNQQNTRLSAIYLNVYPPSKNIGYTETSHSILLIARKDISL